MRQRFETKVAAALDRIGVRPGELVLVALSGGADSVALLHALIALRERLGYRLCAAHFNHRIRGAESDRDEAFAIDLCAKVGVELAVEDAEGLEPDGSNLEERARELRHDFLRRAADHSGADHIALAHHADDQAETVLIRLLRGSGVSGLAAMAEAGPGRLIRPMLSMERREILDYLDEIGAAFVDDSTNLSRAILRNRLRADLVPMLERDYAPGMRRRLVELAAEMRSIDELLNVMAEAELDRSLRHDGALELSRFATLQPALAAAVIRAFIRMRTGGLRRIERVHVEAMRRLGIEGPPNGTVDLPGGWRAEREYGALRIRRDATCARGEFFVAINAEGRTVVAESGVVFESWLIAPKDAPMPATTLEALFDADRISPGLAARNFVPGDRIRPLGIDGTRKVKEVFIDHKIPRPHRTKFPLVVAGDEVVWIPGLVRSRSALVTPDTTRVLLLKATPETQMNAQLRDIKHA